MTINFDTITNNYEVIYVIKTVMKYYLKKIDTRYFFCVSKLSIDLFFKLLVNRYLAINIEGKIGQSTVISKGLSLNYIFF
jgi:hypothetical protein